MILDRGMNYLYPEVLADDRIGGGHPEGLFEVWSKTVLCQSHRCGRSREIGAKTFGTRELRREQKAPGGLRTVYDLQITALCGLNINNEKRRKVNKKPYDLQIVRFFRYISLDAAASVCASCSS